jgi:hypothetical protein
MGTMYLAGERHHNGTTEFDIQVAVNSWQSVNGEREYVKSRCDEGRRVVITPLAQVRFQMFWRITKVDNALSYFRNKDPLKMLPRDHAASRNTSCDRPSCMHPYTLAPASDCRREATRLGNC